MAKLSDVLGALLRDIAESRVQSDLFSRGAAAEYLKDPILRSFPVPRAEVRSAELDFRFAVAAATADPEGADRIVRSKIESRLPELNAAFLRVPFKSQRSQPVNAARPLSEWLSNQRSELEAVWSKAFGQAVEKRLKSGLEDSAGLADELTTEALKAVQKMSRAGNIPLFIGTDTKKNFQENARSWAERLRADVRDASSQGNQTPLALEALITREELAEIPEHALSQVRLTVAIENYEWHESEDETGEPRRKLLLR